MRQKKLTIAFLEEIAEIFEILNYENPKVFLNPPIAILSAIILTFTTSFSVGLLIPLLIMFFSLILSALLRINVRRWIKPVLFILFITIFVSLPLFLAQISGVNISNKNWEDAVYLILRSTAAASIFITIIAHLGWLNLLKGLRNIGIPEEIVSMTGFLIKYTPIFLRDACRMIAAREARLMGKTSYKIIWLTNISVIGDLLVRGYERGLRLNAALKARSFSSNVVQRHDKLFNLSLYDLFLLFFTIIMVLTALTVKL